MVFNINELKAAYEAGERPELIFFWGHTPPADGSINASCFSQWWICRFELKGVTYNCTEQYMMAEKARLFGDLEMLDAIMNASSPKEMKSYGRAVKLFDKDVWEQQGYDIVRRGNRAKFGQNQELRDFLCTTKGHILVEASPYDRIWGIGMGMNHPEARNPLKWRGRNLLGFALTEVREEIAAQH